MPLNRTTAGDVSTRTLALVPAKPSRAPSSEPSVSATRSNDLAEREHLRARLDMALEEQAFLREQLRSAEEWHGYLLETLRAQHRVARESFARDLTALVRKFDASSGAHEPVEGEARTLDPHALVEDHGPHAVNGR